MASNLTRVSGAAGWVAGMTHGEALRRREVFGVIEDYSDKSPSSVMLGRFADFAGFGDLIPGEVFAEHVGEELIFWGDL